LPSSRCVYQTASEYRLYLAQSLVIEVPGLKWGEDDSKDQMLGRALTYLVLYSTLGMMVGTSPYSANVSFDGHGASNSSHKPTMKCPMQTSQLHSQQRPSQPAKQSVPQRLSTLIQALARPTHSLRRPMHFPRMHVRSVGTLARVSMQLSDRSGGNLRLRLLYSGRTDLAQHTVCIRPAGTRWLVR
jgi:hypothetical protein